MYDAIEDCVGESWISDEFMPSVDRKLTGDDERASIVAIFDDLEQVALLVRQQLFGPPIVNDEESHARQLTHKFGVTAIASREGQGGE